MDPEKASTLDRILGGSRGDMKKNGLDQSPKRREIRAKNTKHPRVKP